jgi:hypothetical protein
MLDSYIIHFNWGIYMIALIRELFIKRREFMINLFDSHAGCKLFTSEHPTIKHLSSRQVSSFTISAINSVLETFDYGTYTLSNKRLKGASHILKMYKTDDYGGIEFVTYKCNKLEFDFCAHKLVRFFKETPIRIYVRKES